jgi:hypothetical protein
MYQKRHLSGQTATNHGHDAIPRVVKGARVTEEAGSLRNERVHAMIQRKTDKSTHTLQITHLNICIKQQ